MATITPIQRGNGIVYKARIRRAGQAGEVSKTFHYRSDAEKWARKTEGELDRDEVGLTTEAFRHSLAECIDRFQIERMGELAEGTRLAYQGHLAYWRDKLGHLRLSQLHPAAIAKARDELLTDGRGLKKSSANRYLSCLGAVLTRAQKSWYWLAVNPVSQVHKLTEPPGRDRFLTQAELDRLLIACRASTSTDLLTMVLIAISTGARLGEITGLRWSALDLERDILTLRVGKENAVKGGKRTAPIAPLVKELLKARLAKRKAAAVVTLRPDGLVFPSTVSPTRPANIATSWQRATARADLEGLHFHDLRHAHASFLAANGATLLEIGRVLGHKSPGTTARYSHLSAGHSHALVTEVTAKILGTPGPPAPEEQTQEG